MSWHDATYVSWERPCTSFAKRTCAQEMSFFAAQPCSPTAPQPWFVAAWRVKWLQQLSSVGNTFSASFSHPGECHRSSCPEAFFLLYFQGRYILYCSSHMGQFISSKMFEHSGIGWGRQVGSSRCNHDMHEMAKPSCLNKRTARWPPIACCHPGCHGSTWRSPVTMFESNSQARRSHHLVALSIPI